MQANITEELSGPLARSNTGVGSTNIPRTKATSSEEVVANCTERRAGTFAFTTSKHSVRRPHVSTIFPATEDPRIGTDEIVSALLDIFRNDSLRCSTLYRDLQLIAAHIPASILDQTAKGKAFWDIGIAALALKEERITTMITYATRITTYHVSAFKDLDSDTFASSYSADLVNTTLADAPDCGQLRPKKGTPLQRESWRCCTLPILIWCQG